MTLPLLFVLLLFLASFSRQRKLMVFHWKLSDSKSPRVFRTFLSILVDLGNVVAWIVSARPRFPTFSVPLSSLWRSFWVHQLLLVSRPISCSIVFWSSLARSKYLSLFSFSLVYYYWYWCKLIVFNLNISDSKSPQASWTLLSILPDLNKAVVWMVSTCPLPSLPVPVPILGDYTECPNYNWYCRPFHVL